MAKGLPTTPIGRVSYPSLFKTRASEEGGAQKYSVVLLWPKGTDLSVINKEIKRVIDEKFGGDATGLKMPLRDGDKLDDPKPEQEGHIFASFSSGENYKPGVCDQHVQPIMQAGEVYAGCEGRVSFSAYAWTWKKKKGISLNLGNFQKTGDNERFAGGGSKLEDDFSAIESDDSEEDAATNFF